MSTACDKFLEEQPGPRYNVLVVDDEEDIRSVTKLCLKSMKYMGSPVRVTEAASKAEAIELLKNNLGHPYCCALVDVVMESDHAGLELVDYIRKDINNQAMAIYLRTGQPGQAPEREVMEKHNIDGYVLKTDLTDEKLYSITLAAIKSTLRAFSTTNAMNQLSLFAYGAYHKEQFMARVDMAYKFADQLSDKPAFAPGHYFSVFGKKYSSGTGKAFTDDIVGELMMTAPVKVAGPIEYRTYKEFHMLTSQQSGAMYVGHHIKWPEEWKETWTLFFQLFDHFVMASRN